MATKSLGLALQQSLSPNPAERRQAERALDDFKRQPGFCQLALQLTQAEAYEDGTPAPTPIRQAAALLFKNYIRYGWPAVGSFMHAIVLVAAWGDCQDFQANNLKAQRAYKQASIQLKY